MSLFSQGVDATRYGCRRHIYFIGNLWRGVLSSSNQFKNSLKSLLNFDSTLVVGHVVFPLEAGSLSVNDRPPIPQWRAA
ncbi:hypothetical protein RBSWK_06053 [Rhodopirellula baltica SWK14]|uniref:Uncharacterized protein n=1 Tax=Rhodopirellula baltica SWK14 TaxID=993516 RepID=L7C857_RHOBT|nr:hypothetical protein RBSWK_06053 [Rhodopirellula baltica SWK14]